MDWTQSSLGQRIKYWREFKKKSVTEFAEQIRMDPRNLYNWESDEKTPTPAAFLAIIDAFDDLNPTWLLAGRGVPEALPISENFDKMADYLAEADGIFNIVKLVRQISKMAERQERIERKLDQVLKLLIK
ncbi:MAG: helix-turn-helix transcriptional regulator [Phaeodactylibacter sp.]|nr:helix-turn-helix transcriptional regulator [Phaeodactylibacter sp.]MCB9302672.1 helix-turn-helix transcriptional regulator [Lewinellaceae bacterium]